MMIRSFAVSDVGMRRKNNEDSYLRDDHLNLYVVADGMGGYAAGDVASAEAVDTIFSMVSRNSNQIEAFVAEPTRESARLLKRLLESAVQNACYMTFGLAEMSPERQGMGTTISALLIAGEYGATAQVGDSRVYCIRDGAAIQLTVDHTLVNWQVREGIITPEQALTSPHRNVITRAVGNKDFVQVDTQIFQVHHQDTFLLCSDGLHGYLKDEEIPHLLSYGIEEASRQFIQLACDRGGKDNITSILVQAFSRNAHQSFAPPSS
jgi:protein phosphatase